MKGVRTWIITLAAFLTLVSIVSAAPQHSYATADIEAGAKLYDSNCGRCRQYVAVAAGNAMFVFPLRP